MVNLAFKMLALYMCFNGTGFGFGVVRPYIILTIRLFSFNILSNIQDKNVCESAGFSVIHLG